MKICVTLNKGVRYLHESLFNNTLFWSVTQKNPQNYGMTHVHKSLFWYNPFPTLSFSLFLSLSLSLFLYVKWCYMMWLEFCMCVCFIFCLCLYVSLYMTLHVCLSVFIEFYILDFDDFLFWNLYIFFRCTMPPWFLRVLEEGCTSVYTIQC